MDIQKVIKEIEYEAWSKNLIKDRNNLNFNERTFIINVRRILEKENGNR